MPTFLVLKGSSVIETIRGANPTALRTAILSAAARAQKAPAASSASFSGKGQTLGASSGPTGNKTSGSRTVQAPSIDFGALAASPAAFSQGRGLPSTVIRFLGLYFQTLLSLEPIKAAEESPFRVERGAQRVR